MANINRFNRLLEAMSPDSCYNPANKAANQAALINQMLNRLQALFVWEGLPDTIPARSLELYLQVNGHCCVTDVNGELYAFTGGRGGPPDPYYMPTVYTVANPGLNYSAQLSIGSDCVVIPNDSMYMGLWPIMERYASQITEAELTVYTNMVNGRLFNLISQPDDSTKESAEQYLQKVRNGELAVIAENHFLDGVRTQPINAGSANITALVEYIQYAKQSWFHELGINANYNMKREALNSAETDLNNDQLLPLIDNMLAMRQKACREINGKYQTKIEVVLGSAWAEARKEADRKGVILDNEERTNEELTEELTEGVEHVEAL